MNKETSLQLKGMAILLMLWLHLFSSADAVALCYNTIHFWNGVPLAEVLKKVGSMCVPAYIFLGGYGLAVTRERLAAGGRGGGMGNMRRAAALYANFWCVMLLFWPLGAWLNPQVFASSAADVALNLTGLKYTMNGAWWFLLPYTLLTLMSERLIGWLYAASRRQEAAALSATLALNIAAYLTIDIRVAEAEIVQLAYVNANRLASLLFVFAAGILWAKHRIGERLKAEWGARRSQRTINRTAAAAAAALIVLKLHIGASSLINPWFVFALIPLYAVSTPPASVGRTLAFFGKHSTNMWLTHYFFCHFIFGDAIYSLKYPVAIFAALTAVSLAASYAVDIVYKPVRRRIRRQTTAA